MKRKAGSILIALGLLLTLSALGLLGFNLWDEYRAQQTVAVLTQQLVQTAPETPSEGGSEAPPAAPAEEPAYILNPTMEMPVTTVEQWDYIGTLDFPQRGKTLPVISHLSDSALLSAPCRFVGSPYTGKFIISGHNYRSHLAHLKRMELGEEVRFTDMEGNLFSYTVVDMEIVDGTDVEGMLAGEWDLTLFTCTLGGQQRVTVRCELKD